MDNACDTVAACVIGGTGKISGIVLGVFVLRIIFVALDMRKYLVRK